MADRLQMQITACDAEIQRIKDQAAADIAATKATKALLLQASGALAKAPEIESLLPTLKAVGAL